MRYESAELAKIAINCCLVASVSVANTLAELCERIGADWTEIAPALKLDRRIGAHAYLAPGLGIAGGNLERDLATVIRARRRARHRRRRGRGLGREQPPPPRLGRADAPRRSCSIDRPDAIVAVWGLAYKENTHSIKNSPVARDRSRSCPMPGCACTTRSSRRLRRGTRRRSRASAALEAASGADALMILTPWPEFRQIDASAPRRARCAAASCSIRTRCSIRKAAVAAGLELHTLGRGPMKTGHA